ncbi:MAG: alpha/beta fold hydrolase [Bacteroidia bacterium]|nr:alpha/beta fold hydrolase [Bacteroidia bacterium]
MELNAKSFGQGPALIILHGLFGSLDNWVTHARTLSADFTVIVPDQRNHGKSPHSDRWDYSAMADDLAAFMDKQGIFQAHIAGHSMGGKTAMQFAAEYPERIDRLIVADMAPKAYPPHHNAILDTLNRVNLAHLQSRQEAEDALREGIPEDSVRQFLLKSLGRSEDMRFQWKFNLEVITRNYENILAPIVLETPFYRPTLFVSGGRSHYLQPEDESLIRSYFPHVIFEKIPDAGHWLHADQPEVFIRIVRNFLLS